MNCELARPMFSDYLDGLLEPGRRDALERHLAACEGCRAELEAMKESVSLLRSQAEAPDAPDLNRRVLHRTADLRAQLRRQQRASRLSVGTWLRYALASAAAAGVLLLAGIGGGDWYARHLIDSIGTQETYIFGQRAFIAGAPASLRVALIDRESDQPIAGGDVRLALHRPKDGLWIRLYRGRTDRRGTVDADFRIPDVAPGQYRLAVVANSRKGRDRIEEPVRLGRSVKVMLTTDRPVYQPGQTIHIRTLAVLQPSQKPAARRKVVIEVADPKGTLVLKKPLETTKWGIAFADFELADQINLGDYRIKATLDDLVDEKTVSVKRYVLPKFKVELEADRKYYRPGDSLHGSISANYFFGKPVAGGRVKIELFTFDYEFNKFATVDGRTDADGNFEFDHRLPTHLVGQPLAQGNALVRADVSVIDSARHEERITRTYPVSSQDIKVTLIPEATGLRPDVENIVYVVTSYPSGEPADATVEVKHEGAAQTIRTGDLGVGEFRLKPASSDENSTKVALSVRDRRGAEVEVKQSLGLAHKSALTLRLDKGIYHVGDTAQVVALSGSNAPTVYLDAARGGQTIFTRAAELKDGRVQFAFDIGPDYAGTVVFTGYTITREGAIIADSHPAFVEPGEGLNVRVAADQRSYRPGDEAKIDFRVTGPDGKGTPAALGVSIVDESVFALEEATPGLARLFFALEKEILEPRYQVKYGSDLPERMSVETLLDPQETKARDRDIQRAAKAILAGSSQDVAHNWTATTYDSRARRHREHSWQASARIDWMQDYWPYVLALGVVLAFALAATRGLARTRSQRAVGVFACALAIGGAFLVWSLCKANTALAPVYVGGGRVPLSWQAEPCLVQALPWNANLRVYWGDLDGVPYYSDDYYGSWPGATDGYDVMDRRFAAGDLAGHADLSFNRWSTGPMDRVVAGVPATTPPARISRRPGWSEAERPRPALPPPMYTPIWTASPHAPRKVIVSGGWALFASEPPRMRQFFPETLYVNPQVVTDDDGRASISLAMADSITTWRLTALANSLGGGIGSVDRPVRVFQDFFVDLDLPVALTEGDQISLPVAVYNYLPGGQDITITLDREDWFALEGEPTRKIGLSGNTVTVVHFPITARRIGRHRLTVHAQGSQMSDALRRSVNVEPDGKPVEQVLNGQIDGTVKQSVSIPGSAIPGTGKLLVKVYPGVFSQLVEGLEGMLHAPYGCFEQTSSVNYPNLLALDYLKRTGQIRPDVQMKAEQFLNLGYQRLLTFEVPGGGFDWYGNSPAKLSLTAYGLRQLNDMSQVFPVDKKLIARTRRWLLNRQRDDGSWAAGQGDYGWGGPDGALTTTAYVVWSLAEAGQKGVAIDRGLEYLTAHANQATDAYTTALVANALVAADPESAAAKRIIDRLADAGVAEEGGVVWPSERTIMYGRGRGAGVETTALAAYALLKSGRQQPTAQRALDYLVRTRGAQGTWGSTQATILALKALVTAAGGGRAGSGSVEVRLDGKRVKTLALEGETAEVMHLIDLGQADAGKHAIELRGTGEAKPVYQIVSRYYLPWSKVTEGEESLLDIDLHYDRTKLRQNDTVAVRATVTYRGSQPTNMVIVDLGIPPGFRPLDEDLDALVEKGAISRYESTGRQIIIYLRSLAARKPVTIRYRLKARFPVKAMTPPSQVYEYYNPDPTRTIERPIAVRVT